MLKTVPLLFIGMVMLLFALPATVFAQVASLDSSGASLSATQGVDSSSNANLVISAIEGFLKNLDSFAGGLVFTTPDLFGNSVTLGDGTEVQGLHSFRSIFYLLSVPVSAILLFWFGGLGMASNQLQFLQQLAIRIAKYVFLLLFLVPLLSFSITASNLLTEAVLSIPQVKEQQFTSFVTDYFASAREKIASGQATGEELAIPNPNFFDLVNSIVYVVTQVFFFLITLLALIFGLLFIIMQFVLRFISLLFLSLIFPIVAPFVLVEKTAGIVQTYLKIWFTFLIHQPAFALGYVMVMVIVRSVFENGGANIALLLLYIGALFFLGTVNILAARIFADSWTALGASSEAFALARIGGSIFGGSARVLRDNRGKLIQQLGKFKPSGFNESLTKRPAVSTGSVVTAEYAGSMLHPGTMAGPTMYGANPGNMSNTPPAGMPAAQAGGNATRSPFTASTSPTRISSIGSFNREFARKGFTTEIVDKKQGIVSVAGTGYTYHDKKNDLSYTYLSKKDALATGISEGELTTTVLPKRNYIDLSQFRKGENPFNAEATKKAMSLGYDSGYAHVNRRSDGVTIKHHLEMNKEQFGALGVDGVISRHFDNHRGRATRETTRIVSLGKVKE